LPVLINRPMKCPKQRASFVSTGQSGYCRWAPWLQRHTCRCAADRGHYSIVYPWWNCMGFLLYFFTHWQHVLSELAHYCNCTCSYYSPRTRSKANKRGYDRSATLGRLAYHWGTTIAPHSVDSFFFIIHLFFIL